MATATQIKVAKKGPLDTFEKLIKVSPDPEIMFTFLSEKIPNLEEIVSEEAKKLRDESDEIMSAIGK
jgi:hypothetical protein